MQRLSFDRDFDLPPDRVFEYFAEHENLEAMLGAKVTRGAESTDGHRNGVGSVRRIKLAGPVRPFEETITAFEPNELIEYKITKGTPLKDHFGRVTFTPTEKGTHLNWDISFGAVVPGLDFLIAQGLKRNITKGLAKARPSA